MSLAGTLERSGDADQARGRGHLSSSCPWYRRPCVGRLCETSRRRVIAYAPATRRERPPADVTNRAPVTRWVPRVGTAAVEAGRAWLRRGRVPSALDVAAQVKPSALAPHLLLPCARDRSLAGPPRQDAPDGLVVDRRYTPGQADRTMPASVSAFMRSGPPRWYRLTRTFARSAGKAARARRVADTASE